MTQTERRILSVLEQGPASVDVLVEKSGLSVVKILQGLSVLHVNQLVKEGNDHQYYSLAH